MCADSPTRSWSGTRASTCWSTTPAPGTPAANCFHPGVVSTEFNRNHGPLMGLAMQLIHLFARNPERGAETLVWLADSPEVSHLSGGYFMDRRLVRPSQEARDEAAARRLWAVSEEQTGVSAAAR